MCCRLSTTVWKSLLEKVVKVGDAHLAAHDLYVHEVAEVAKSFRVKKQRAGKQVHDFDCGYEYCFTLCITDTELH